MQTYSLHIKKYEYLSRHKQDLKVIKVMFIRNLEISFQGNCPRSKRVALLEHFLTLCIKYTLLFFTL